MKTRTSQNGVAGIMSRLILNIKSAALALAALALAAPSARGADYTWKAGASGNTNVGSNWTGGTAPTSGANNIYFINGDTALCNVNNNITMTSANRFADAYVRSGVFRFTGEWWFKTFNMADTDNSEATLTKTGKWVCNNGGNATYQFRYGVGKNSKASFTNESGDIGTIGTGRVNNDTGFAVGYGEGSDAEFILKAGTVTTSTALVLGYNTSSKGLLVMDGGTMQCNNTNVIARGTGSTGIAEINGGTFNVNKPLFVAKGQNSTGTLIIGGGTYANSSDTFVGYGSNSDGKVAVTNGAFSTSILTLGAGAGASSTFVLSNGTVTAGNEVRVGNAAGNVTRNYFEVAGGTFTQTAANHLRIGYAAGAAGTTADVAVKGNGKMNVGYSIILGEKTGGKLTIEDDAQVVVGTKNAGGHVNMCYNAAYNGDSSFLNLNGGTLTTSNVRYGSATSGNAFVTFNGGTLKANQANTTFIVSHERLFAKVGPNGGTIDAAGFAITIPAVLASGVEAGETDGGMTFKGGGTVTLSGANTYTGATVIDAGTTIQMPSASNLAGDVVVTNVTLGACPMTVLTLTGAGADASAVLSRCSLAADAPDTVELTVDGASVKATAKAAIPATARLVYDSGADSWNWLFRDMTDAVIPSADESALEAGSVHVIFGSTGELAAIADLGSLPAWASGYQMAATFDLDATSVSTALPSEFTVEAGTVIDMKGCAWTLPAGLKSATVDFTVTNSVDATKAVLTVDVASGATFTETHLTLGGNIELRKTGAGTYAMTKDQPHTGGTVVVAGSMAKADMVTVAPASGSAQSLSVEGGSLDISNSGHLIVGGNGVGEFTITNATASMNNFFIGSNDGTGSGTANIDGGTVTVNGWSYLAISANSGGAVLNLNGGTLGTRRINVGTVPDSLILFNGGTLHINGVTAAADTGFSIGTSNGTTPEHLTIAVGEKGGTIKTTHSEDRVKICSGIVKASGVETDGGLRIMGGGKLTLTGSLAYTGGTTVEVGTTLVIPDTSLGGGLSVEFPETTPTAGTYTLVTTAGEGVFTDAALPDVSAFPFYRALLSADGKSILITRVAPSIAVTGFDKASGNVTVALENIDVPLSLVVAWGDKDYGATLTSWPYNKRSILAASVAAGTTTATYALPAEARAAGAYWRMFLGDGAVAPYDEEVAYIQPDGVGACIKTDFTPGKLPTFEAKINLTDNAIESECDYGSVFDAGTGYQGGVWVFCNASGKIGAKRYGYAYSSKTYSDDVILHGIWSVAKSTGPNATFIVNNDVVWANGFNNTMTGDPSAVRFWAGFKGKADDKQFGASAYRFIYSKWWTSSGTLQAHFVPVKKNDVYGLYDVVNQKFYTNAGAEGTSFKGGETVTAYSPVSFAGGQLAASAVRMMGTVELAFRDWARPEEHVSLTWTAPGTAATLWVVYSNASMASAPGDFAAPSEWNFCTNIAVSVAADATANAEPYTLCNPLADGSRYKSMRFVLATGDSTEDNLVPLLVSEPYRTLKQGSVIYMR